MIKQTIIFNQEESDYNSERTPNTIAQLYGYPKGVFSGYNLNQVTLKKYTEEEIKNIYMGSIEGIIPVVFDILDNSNTVVLKVDAFIRTSFIEENEIA